MATKTVYKYATTVTSQVNPNLSPQLVKWENVPNATGHTSKYATSHYTLTKKAVKYEDKVTSDKNGKQSVVKVPTKWEDVYNKPWTLASSDFGFDIPSNAYIRKVTFEVRMNASANLDVPAPIGNFRIGTKLYNKKFDNTTQGLATGWNDGCYLVVPKTKLSNEFKTFYYTIDEYEINRAGYSPNSINHNIAGIDLIFQDGKFNKTDKDGNATGNVHVEWILCRVEYDIPSYELSITSPIQTAINRTKNYVVDFDGTSNSPQKVITNNDFELVVHCKNKSKAKGSNQTINVSIPWGTTLKSATPSNGTYSNGVWTVPAKANADYTLTLVLTPQKNGVSNITASTSSLTADYYYYALVSLDYEGYDDITVFANNEIRKRTNSCIQINIHGISDDTSLTVTATANKSILYPNFSLDPNTDSSITLASQTSTTATLTVPNDEEFNLGLLYCFHPTSIDDITFTVSCSDSSTTATKTFKVLDSPTFNFSELINFNDEIKASSHRVATEVDTGATIIPCVTDDRDAVMIMSDCRVNMNILEDLDYIGCIPLEQTHFNPKSTFKDTLLNSTYKNKRYMGKKLATDEDITLNVRLHPQQVTTLQGLIEMDKPIPINANHKCFEGDSLNHRGWCEVYAVKTEYTNPHWYKCDIDVKYLTHNLNTRFKIDKGAKVSDYNIPSVMGVTFDSGTNLSDNDYFTTDTDGTFYYSADEDYIYEYKDENGNAVEDLGDSTTLTYHDVDNTEVELNGLDEVLDYLTNTLFLDVVTPVLNENIKIREKVSIDNLKKNSFNIDNGQHIRITSNNPIGYVSNVSFSWSSILMTEIRENNVSRIVRLIDKDSKQTVFEYQYDNIEVNDDDITANIIYRVMGDSGELYSFNGGKPITFRYNATDVTTEEDVDVETDNQVENASETGEAHYGSTINLILNNGSLTVVDEGFNGRESIISDIQIGDGQYLYQVEWINNNIDAETSDVECVFDFIVQDTILDTTYSNYFGNIVISPFPVSDKKVLFTRNGEEGTIYYYHDDNEEFSYLIDPYYQYQNGVDLTYNGYSIFDLNYGYDLVYIQNGLVRLGFNRLTGYLYLGKYDSQSQEYITTHRLHLEKFDDINVNSISDDKIEIQASDSVFTMYRGHPYVKIKHELEDIYIDTSFNRVWAEQVGNNNAVDLPTYWDLENDSNLLDECVGGSNGLKSSCITASPKDNDKTTSSISWSNFPNNIQVGDTKFTLSMTSLSTYTDEVEIDGTQCSFGSYEWEVVSDGKPTDVSIVSYDEVEAGDTDPVYAQVTDSEGNGVSGQTVSFYVDS